MRCWWICLWTGMVRSRSGSCWTRRTAPCTATRGVASFMVTTAAIATCRCTYSVVSSCCARDCGRRTGRQWHLLKEMPWGDSSPFVKAKRAIKRGSYSQWTWRDLTRGKTRVIPKMALETPPRFPWRSACCQAPAVRGGAAPPRTPSHSPASGLHRERVPHAPKGNHRADSPPVAKPARKLFQTKVRLQTASPHAPVAPLPTLGPLDTREADVSALP